MCYDAGPRLVQGWPAFFFDKLRYEERLSFRRRAERSMFRYYLEYHKQKWNSHVHASDTAGRHKVRLDEPTRSATNNLHRVTEYLLSCEYSGYY